MKIINTIMGVLVRIILNILDDIDFIIHFKRNKKEMEDFDLERVNHRKEFEKYKNELIDVHQELNNLSTKYIDKKNRLGEVEKQLHESTLAIQEENHRYLDMKYQYEEAIRLNDVNSDELASYLKLVKRLERKVNRRDDSIDKLRNEKSELIKQIDKLNLELESLKNKNKFLESRLPKKTLEEIKAYDYGFKEVLKRSKKNENSKRDV